MSLTGELNVFHELVASYWPLMRWPLVLARMLVLFVMIRSWLYFCKTRRTWLVVCLLFPMLYYFDAAVAQSFPGVRHDTPTLTKVLANVGWLGVLCYLYWGTRRLDALGIDVRHRVRS